MIVVLYRRRGTLPALRAVRCPAKAAPASGRLGSCASMVEDRPPGSRRVPGGTALVLLLTIIVAAAILIGQPWRSSREPNRAPAAQVPAGTIATTRAEPERITGYVGAGACRECHPGESALS